MPDGRINKIRGLQETNFLILFRLTDLLYYHGDMKCVLLENGYRLFHKAYKNGEEKKNKLFSTF
jgi:hypothetical protein